jgi:uncharacterized protein YutE (UPF0331/DUF86 family)
MPLNAELVERKINLILQDLDLIRRLSMMPLEQYLEDPAHEALAERYLERLIGRAIDINFHIVTEILLVTPRDYADSFLSLQKLGILSPDAARELARLAGLRNRIAHDYNGIDERIIHASLGKIASVMPAYLSAVKAFVDKQYT